MASDRKISEKKVPVTCNPPGNEGGKKPKKQLNLKYYKEAKCCSIRDRYPWKRVEILEKDDYYKEDPNHCSLTKKVKENYRKNKGTRSEKRASYRRGTKEVFLPLRHEKLNGMVERGNRVKEWHPHRIEKLKGWGFIEKDYYGDVTQKSCRTIHKTCGQLARGVEPESKLAELKEKNKDKDKQEEIRPLETEKPEHNPNPQKLVTKHEHPQINNKHNWKDEREPVEDITKECFVAFLSLKQQEKKSWESEKKIESFIPKTVDQKYIFRDILRQNKIFKEDLSITPDVNVQSGQSDVIVGEVQANEIMANTNDKKYPKVQCPCAAKKEKKDHSLERSAEKDPCKSTAKEDETYTEQQDQSLMAQCLKRCHQPPECPEEGQQNLVTQCAKFSKNKPKPQVTKLNKIPEDNEPCFDNDTLLCKVKQVGCCEQIVCKEMPQRLSEMEDTKGAKDRNVIRVLKCKVCRDDCNREVLTCKEHKSANQNECKKKCECNDGSQEEAKKIFQNENEQDGCQKPEIKLVVGQKLVCKEETFKGFLGEEDKAVMCNMVEVRETIIDDPNSAKCKSSKARESSPFTFEDLLKKSEEIRKANDEKFGVRNKKYGTKCKSGKKKFEK